MSPPPTDATHLRLRSGKVDLQRERIERGGVSTQLTTQEARLLAYLAERPGQDVSREELLEHVWGYGQQTITRAVDSTVRRLRSKIELSPAQPDHIQTVWGHGYRFEPLATPTESAAQAASGAGLAPELDAFFGRAADLTGLEDALGRGRLVTIKGPAGIGKTRLALHFAHAHQRRTGRSLAFADLSEALTTSDILAVVARTIALPGTDEPAPTDPIDALGHKLGALGEALLVLDNLEQITQPAAEVVGRWLAAAPELRLMCTSREALGLKGERVLELGPLSKAGALSLLLDRTGLSESPSTRRLSERLEGWPLAIELASQLTAVMSPDELIERLQKSLDLLESHHRDTPARHTTLRTAIEGSWATLSEREREVLCQCAVFRGGFTVRAAEAVVQSGGAVLPVLRTLQRKSLLRPEGDHRLGLFMAVREFAEEGLARRGDSTRAAERHRQWFASQARERHRPGGSPVAPDDVRWLSAEYDNLYSALERSIASQPADAARISMALQAVHQRSGLFERASELHSAAIQALGEHDPVLLGYLHGYRAETRARAGRADECDADLLRALQLAESCGDQVLHGRILHIRGVTLHHAGRTDESLAHMAQAVPIMEAAGDLHNLAICLRNRGVILFQQGRIGEAREHLEHSFEQAEAEGLSDIAATTLLELGNLDLEHGRPERGIARLEAAEARVASMGSPVRAAKVQEYLARADLLRDQPASALARVDASAGRCQELGATYLWAELAHVGGVACYALGDLDGAKLRLSAAQRQLAVHRSAPGQAFCFAALAAVEASGGRHAEAKNQLHRAQRHAEGSDAVRLQRLLHVAEGLVAAAAGDTERARESLAMSEARTHDARGPEHLSEVAPFYRALQTATA